ncbi:retrovirus-related pol polyprotein from transposon TNT 1-94 [Tanacetum coccineum]|uniref:Retrovirus-related pol polyprotein from transposon TNT 1-94 n=1 Tax=Tanacetum coccineum TaxID=301880 RepID=A0ABQ5C6Z9_9ASTR
MFNQMEAVIDQCFVDKNDFEIQIKQLRINNDQLLNQIMSQEIMHIAVNSVDILDVNKSSVNECCKCLKLETELLKNKNFVEKESMHIAVNSVDILDVNKSSVNECCKCLELETELFKNKDFIEKDVFDKLVKSYSTLEKHCISLELATQINQEIFQKENSGANQNAPTFNQLFKINELKAQSQEKDTVIMKLKEKIKSLSGKANTKCSTSASGSKPSIGVKCSIEFCDSDLEVAFRKHTCFIRNLDGVDLLKGSRGLNLYTLSLENLLQSSPICLLSKASKTKSWLWHRRLSHLNFDYITSLAKHGLVRGLPKLKYQKDHLYSACALDLGKLKPEADRGFLVGYAPAKKAFRIYNKRTRIIIETIHVHFDELTTMDSKQFSSGPGPKLLTPRTIIPTVIAPVVLTGTPSSTIIDQDAPSTSTSQTNQETPSLVISLNVEEANDIEVAHMDNNPYVYFPTPKPSSEESSSQELVPHPDRVMIITLKWIYKVKLDELGGMLKNKACLIARGYRQEEGIDFKESFAPISQLVDPENPNHVYKLKKALYGLKQAPQACRPDLVFVVCMCSQYQAKSTEKHLHAVKQIFRYLRGTINIGLWYSKDSCIALTSFADADYVGCQDTRKCTSGSMQLLGNRLEQVENGVVEMYFVRTEYQVAGIFTKPLARERLEFLINKLGMRRIKFLGHDLLYVHAKASVYVATQLVLSIQISVKNSRTFKSVLFNEDDSNDDGGDNDSESGRTEFDEDENHNLNQNDDDIEDEYEDEYVRTPSSYEYTDDENKHVEEEEYDRIDEELYKDVNVKLKDV